MYTRLISGVLALILCWSAVPAQAADSIVPDNEDGNLVLSRTDYKDLYAAGSVISVEQPIDGDLFVAGASVNVNAPIAQDLFIAAGNVTVLREVRGDVRIAAGNITLSGPITEDVLITGGTVTITDAAVIGGDLWVGAGSVVVNGAVTGRIKVAGGSVTLNSRMADEVMVQAEQLTLGERSVSEKVIRYTGAKPAIQQAGSQIAGVEYTRSNAVNVQDKAWSGVIWSLFLGLLMWSLTALLMLRLFNKTAPTVVAVMSAMPWQSLGIGVAGVVVIPVVAILCLLTVVGGYVAGILLAVYVLLLLLGVLVAAAAVGEVVMGWWKKRSTFTLTWREVLLGVFLLGLLGAVPVLGWFLTALATCMGVGALLLALRDRVQQEM